MSNKKRYSASAGFTLLELMICVAIIAIIAAIALPQYQGYIEKGDLAAAKTVLTTANQDIAQAKLGEVGKNLSKSDLEALLAKAKDRDNDSSRKYTFGLNCASGSDCTNYNLTAIPNLSGKNKALWMNNNGKTYICDKSVKLNELADPSNNNKCEIQ